MKDNRSMVVIAIIMACIVIMMMTIVASAGGGVKTGARAASLYEPHTGTFIYENNSDLRLPMASTTKIMTALLAIEHCALNESVEIPIEAVGIEGSSLYLKEGDVLTVKDLIYSLLLQSANDAAAALAIKISGDISGFAELMNKKAADLGLTDTHFENPHGLDSDEHYTTARDLALITTEAMQNEFFKKVVSTYKYSFTVSGNPRIVVNHNKLLRMYDGAVGVKTGYTRISGRCLVSAAERDGITLIAVTLDDPDDWRDHKNLLDYGFSQYERISARSIAPEIVKVPVINSESPEVTASLFGLDEIKLIKRRDEPEFTATLDVKQYAVAPIKKGDAVGEVIFRKGDEEVLRAPLIASIDVKEKSEKKFGIFDIFDFGDKSMEKVRLQKFIADVGIMSRRAAEQEIASGHVSVNGHVAVIGMKVDPKNDLVTYKGTRIRYERKEYTYILMNKPRGYLCSTTDDRGRKCVTDLLDGVKARVYPVGRLDLISEGILLLTDDGELKNRLTHPSHTVPKVYRVKVAGSVSDEQYEILTSPLNIDGYVIKPVEVSIAGTDVNGTVLKMTLYEGRNRQIRKMCELAGLTVKRLSRVSIGKLKLDGMPVGKWRYLTDSEVEYLYTATKG